MKLVGGGTDLLLGVLILVVLSITGSIVLRLRIVTGATLLRPIPSLTVTGCASTVASSRSTTTVTVVLPLWRPEATLRVSVDRCALPDLGTPPRRDVRPATSDVVSCSSSPPPAVTA